jgi:hypothetical protein
MGNDEGIGFLGPQKRSGATATNNGGDGCINRNSVTATAVCGEMASSGEHDKRDNEGIFTAPLELR